MSLPVSSTNAGKELKLLHYIYRQPNLDEIRGHPQKVIDLIHEFEKDSLFMNVGAEKGKVVTNLIDELKPKTMIELGCYVGYSAILFGEAVRRNGGERYLSLELNPEFAAIANMLVELAGLRDFVCIIFGRSDLSLHKLLTSGELKKVELLFIDHYKPAYTTDLKLCEHFGAIVPGSVLAADNVLYPGNPPYLEYVRSTVEQKREAAKSGPSQSYNTTGMAERTVESFVGKDDVPTFDFVGNPNLVYQSQLCQPEGLQTYNVGVVGYGFSAKIFHIPFVKEVPELKLYAIVQRTPKQDDDAEKDHPGVKSFRTTEEMVQDPAIDVVIITTAPDSHFAQCKLALEAGKHVVCEKPFTPTTQEADDLIAIAKKNNKQLAVFQNRRWDADFVTLSKLVKNGSLGRISEYETHFDRHRPEEPASDSHKWKNKVIPGGSAIYDLGTHLLDQAVHLLGLPARVTGFIGSARAANTSSYEDSFTVLLHYANGTMVTAKATVVSPEDEQLRFWVRGDKGSFKKYHLDIQEDQLKAGIMPQDKGYGREPSERYGALTTIQNGKPVKEVVPTVEPPTYTEYYRKLVRALNGEGELPASGAEAREVIRLIELARESSRTGRTLGV
ncbi:unnamed protein product [Penicillium egyptiacum]|uniref:Gfo/Idh/MocA-like oxidoreductase N-terminal domain-containing protein n=1 Tax=Penicillium egyptiacum TaxID=1303716 RepID=A0A9W4KAH4_9EURO|nr:unnamed protein product [Penicillium egyptiacum]